MKNKLLSISDYIIHLVGSFTDKRTKNNIQNLVSKIFTNKNIQLWKISENNKEYERFHNLINGELVSKLNVEIINKNLLINSIACLKGQLRVVVIHDGSDIRKPESEQLENIGWVQDLDGNWIKGYKTFNSVLIDNQSGTLKLLSCTPYSSSDPKFISEKEKKEFENGKLTDIERKKEIETILEEEESYNTKKINKEQIQKIHDKIRAENPDIVIIHVLDRGFDSVEIFKFIESLGDKYVIRFKSNRNSNEKIINEKGKEVFLKLITKEFANKQEAIYTKVSFQKKVYQDAKAIFEWDTVVIENKVYHVTRVRFFSKDGKKIFKDPMLLISNYIISSFEMSQYVYEIYMQRTRIEGTFKFLKEVLGWESFRIQDFESIKNLIALAFFIGGYFYEIEHELTNDETVRWICKFGGGKGKISRYYFFEGLSKLLIVNEFEKYRIENNITDEQIKLAYEMFAIE